MFTQHMKRQKKPQYIEMKPIKTQTESLKTIKQRQAQIKASFQNIKSLQLIMMKSSTNKRQQIDSYKKQLAIFNQTQKKLLDMQLGEDRSRILKEVQAMQEDLKKYEIQLTGKLIIGKNHYNFQQPNLMRHQLELQQKISTHSLRTRLLDQQQQQISYIQKKMKTIKQLTISSAELVFGQGIKLNIGEKNIKNAVINIQSANKQLMEVNQYQKDRSKVRPILFCLIFLIVIVVLLMYSAFNK